MLKRDHRDENQDQPVTPVAESKRPRDSIGSGSLQDLRTPLKTASGTLLPGSASFDFISPRRPGDEDEERRRNRAELVKKQQESREALRSPSAGASPRAEPLSTTLKRSSSNETGIHFGSSPSINGSTISTTPANSSNLQAQTAQGTRSILTASKSRLSLSTTRLNNNQPPPMTAEQMTKSFDEWMKMAADNKINSKNSWSFALIDYFSELTFLRDGDSINFQKASCTLDGCVKIYASRVDSVVDETTKLLNGLSDKSNKFKDFTAEDDEDNEAKDGDNTSNIKTSKAKKSSLRTVETIEKNPESLILKNFDLEFAIDPLFKKTSAEFDESGTKGALLKNLECSPIDNLIIFDSSDQIKMDFSLAEQAEKDDESIDISLLTSMFGSAIIDLDKKFLCPTFDDYKFNCSNADIKGTLEKLSRVTAELPEIDKEFDKDFVVEIADNEEESDFEDVTNDKTNAYDLLMPNDDDGDYYDEPEQFGNEPSEPLETQNEMKSVKWATGNDISDETGLSYFDGAFKQTWAGPEHWKIRKSQRIINNNNNSSANGSGISINSNSKSSSGSRRVSKVEKVAIDFINSVIDFRQIFAKPSTSNQISLPKSSIVERSENDHLLPDDLHFSSGSLLKLFIKPTWKRNKDVNRLVRNTRSTSKLSNEENFVERNFWISQENHQDGIFQETEIEEAAENEVVENYDDDGLFDDYYDDVSPMIEPVNVGNPIDNINADYVNPENLENQNTSNISSNISGNISGNVDYNKNLVAAPKFTNALQLNYARVAKRVDVAKLKATLWNEFVEKTSASSKQQQQQPSQQRPNTFSNLINNLSKSYPSEALADVSVPYCFICLLHLANEKNLEIKSEGNDLVIRN